MLKDEISLYVPRVLYPDRPLPLMQKFLQIFAPSKFEDGVGYAFFIFADGYWVAGRFSVVVFSLCFGYGISRFHYALNDAIAKSNVVCIVYGHVVYDLAVSSVRSGLILVFKVVGMALIPLIVLKIGELGFRWVRSSFNGDGAFLDGWLESLEAGE